MTAPSAEIRAAISDLYAEYAACLDHGAITEWPDFFTENCSYVVQPRENYDAGLPLALMRYESKGMLQDRAYGVANTLFHAPYYQRHIVSAPRITAFDGDSCEAEANFVVIRTKRNMPSEVFVAGWYEDRLACADDGWKFEGRICVLDTEPIPNALIYPI